VSNSRKNQACTNVSMESKKRKRENTVRNVSCPSFSLCKGKHFFPSTTGNRGTNVELGISNPKGERITKPETAALLAKQLEKVLKQKGGPSLTQYLYDCIRQEMFTGGKFLCHCRWGSHLVWAAIPPEVWESVFLRLSDIRDLRNCKLVPSPKCALLAQLTLKVRWAKDGFQCWENPFGRSLPNNTGDCKWVRKGIQTWVSLLVTELALTYLIHPHPTR